MGHYKSNLRDIEFNLFEVFGAADRLGKGPFAEMDVDSARDLLRESEKLASGPIADSFVASDREPPVYDPAECTVTMNDEFKKSFQTLWDAGYWSAALPESLGGIGAPPSLNWAMAEMFLGANPALYMSLAGPGFAAILDALGTDEQQHWAQIMIERQWGATMVLTEPDAGSDVGAGRAKAVQQEDGTWHIEGVKRFITGGENDFNENIIHLTLARPEGATVGTKGLSLFVVPKFHFDTKTGEIGERNGVYTTNIEKKMGIKSSSTCELTYGEKQPAVGYLVGDVHDGIAQMFKVIEYARMLVGTKAIATLSTGYLNALDYAKNRVQGADLTQMLDKTAPRVTITHHPDVRRSLMTQKAYSEGLRALVAYTAKQQDEVMLHHAEHGAGDMADRLNDLLLPIVKGVGSERAWVLLGTESLQTFGGSGFLQDYPLEQYVRDAKIDTLYEGTTAIQGMDFFFRKMVRDQFQAVTQLAANITETVKNTGAGDQLAESRQLLAKALEDVQGMIGVMGGWLMKSQENPNELYRVGLNTTRLLMACGDLVIGWLLLKQADVATEALAAGASERDKPFYNGKLAIAKWFAANRLPLLTAELAVAEATTLDVMELPEEDF
ncbi:MAG: acyl-CoA dehydrogenase [Candidatus Nanopelagicales bacterium]|nr:acyl-CoA dehydrogenase [Candidatus Nanopelagicales bacterium]